MELDSANIVVTDYKYPNKWDKLSLFEMNIPKYTANE